MGFDPDNPYKWFTAGEAALIAEGRQVLGVPWTRWGMTKLLKQVATEDADESAAISRTRAGQKGGGGTEFYWCYFPEPLWDELDAEVGRRESAAKAERSAIDPDTVALTAHDEQLMRDLASDHYGHINHFERAVPRRVRRSWVIVRGYRYMSWDIDPFAGQNVLVVLPAIPDPRPAFIWKCDPETKCLAAHGEDGLICMTSPGWLWLPGTRPRKITKK